MRIGNIYDVNMLTLKHKGKDLKFGCYLNQCIQEDKEVVIEFIDLTEVDALISMLDRFRRELVEYIGIWDCVEE